MDLEVVDALKAAGVPDDKARAVAASLRREIDQRYTLHAAHLVTRGDLVESIGLAKHELVQSIGAVKLELVQSIGAVKLEMTGLHAEAMAATARLETRMVETKAELIRWFLGSFVAMAGVVTAMLRLMNH